MAKKSKVKMLWACPDCLCADLEGTAWIDLNTGEPTGGDPPDEDAYCPACQEHYRRFDQYQSDTPGLWHFPPDRGVGEGYDTWRAEVDRLHEAGIAIVTAQREAEERRVEKARQAAS